MIAQPAGSTGADAVRRSCLYEGVVAHRRFGRIPHAFRRRIYLFFLDLAELPDALSGGRFWSAERRALARFDRRDHLGDPSQPLDACVRALVAERTGRRPTGPIAILTQLRHFGIGFNPISVYYCYDAAGERVETLVAEVRNTPWLEMHCYVLPLDATTRGPLQTPKEFHVSPFLEMDYAYHWRVSEPGDELLLGIENWRGNERAFQASLSGRRRPLEAATLIRMLLRYPLMSAQVIAGIYFEALRLWWKGVALQSHPRWIDDASVPLPSEPS
jgi:uncharacterized protein